MREQVKEWIVDKNLTTDSFDSIMIGVIYNSGHSTLDDPEVREWIEMHPSEFRRMLPPNLSDDQQVVLDWLKKKMTITDIEPIELIWRLKVNSTKSGYRDMPVYKSYRRLTPAQQFQVLAAFASYGLECEE